MICKWLKQAITVCLMSLITSNMQKMNFKLWCIGVKFLKVSKGHMVFDRGSNDDLRYMSANNGRPGFRVLSVYRSDTNFI